MSEIPTTTATFRALRSIPLPWIFATLVGGGGLAGGTFLGGAGRQVVTDVAAMKVQIDASAKKLDTLLDKIEDLEDRAGELAQAIAVSEARHGHDD